jgi:hypothetical protein
MAKLVTIDEYRRQIANGMSEETLRLKIKGLAKELGWMSYHTHDSRRSDAGWPDLALVHPIRGRFMIRELKDERRKVTTEQADWLHALKLAGVDAGVWRHMDFVDETVLRELLA